MSGKQALSQEAKHLLDLCNQLKDIRNRSELNQALRDLMFLRSQSDDHEHQYLEIERYALRHMDAVIELIVTQTAGLNEMLSFLFISGSVEKSRNPHLVDLFSTLHQNRGLLTEGDQNALDWYHSVHNY